MHAKVAKTVEEACALIEMGYEHVTEFENEGIKIFKKKGIRKMPWV